MLVESEGGCAPCRRGSRGGLEAYEGGEGEPSHHGYKTGRSV